MPPPISDEKVVFVRHTVATLAYRTGKAVRGVPPDFADFRAAPGSRSAGEILAHMGDLVDWATWLLRGQYRGQNTAPLLWDDEVARFFEVLGILDRALVTTPASTWSLERIFQGPIADALTHAGQINMLRRLAGYPVRGENYAKAEIAVGRTGLEQTAPPSEFD